MTQPHRRPEWTRGGALAAGLALVLAAGLGCRRTRAQDWAASAPAGTIMAVSGQAGWLLEQPGFQQLMERYPYADQSLDLFLKKARISPHQESGRISIYVTAFNGPAGAAGGPGAPDFLIQLGGFRDPAGIQVAMADAFPVEGSLPAGRRELPVFVILDLNAYHFRAVADPEGRIWIGDLRVLARLGAGGPEPAVLSALAWIGAGAPLQGFLRPGPILAGPSARIPPELAKNLPEGLEALAWGVTPGPGGRDGLHRFELAVTGSPAAVQQVTPWLQRFLAAAAAVPGAPAGPAPELLQERARIGLRCQLTGGQIDQLMARLAQPGLSFHAPKP